MIRDRQDPLNRLCVAIIHGGFGRVSTKRVGLLVTNQAGIPRLILRTESNGSFPIEVDEIDPLEAEKFGAALIEWARTIQAEEADYERRQQQRQERRDRSKSDNG